MALYLLGPYTYLGLPGNYLLWPYAYYGPMLTMALAHLGLPGNYLV